MFKTTVLVKIINHGENKTKPCNLIYKFKCLNKNRKFIIILFHKCGISITYALYNLSDLKQIHFCRVLSIDILSNYIYLLYYLI